MAELIPVDDSAELTHLALSGRLDLAGVQAIEARFAILAGARRRSTIVDLSQVETISSLGIGMLVNAARGLRLHGKTMVLLAPAPTVEQLLRLTNVTALLPIAATKAEALALIDGASERHAP